MRAEGLEQIAPEGIRQVIGQRTQREHADAVVRSEQRDREHGGFRKRPGETPGGHAVFQRPLADRPFLLGERVGLGGGELFPPEEHPGPTAERALDLLDGPRQRRRQVVAGGQDASEFESARARLSAS